MNLTVDGVIYSRQAVGGISRFYNSVLPLLCTLEPDLRIRLLISKPYRQALPTHERIDYCHLLPRDLKPDRLFRRLRPRADQLLKWHYTAWDSIWHSTYHTLPPKPVKAIVATIYDLVYHRFPDLYAKPGEELLRQRQRQHVLTADLVLCISQTTADDVVDFFGVPREKIRVCPIGFDPLFAPQQARDQLATPPTAKPFFLYVGRRKTHKNFWELVAGYGRWPGKQDVDLVVVGAPWTAEEARRLYDLGIADQVRLLANPGDQALRDMYVQAAALVFPSLWEGFGIPLLEAMACGCPIIASSIPSSIEVAGDCALFFDLGDAESLVAAFELALSEGRDSARVRAGLARAAEYSWERTAEHMLQGYRSL